MNAPNNDTNKRDHAPMRDDAQRAAEETTDANIEMNDEFTDARGEGHLEQDAGIEGEPFGGDEAEDRADTVINSGIVGRSSG